MPTNRRRRLYGRREPLSPQLRAFLESGDYASGEPDVDTYRLAGITIRGDLAPLAAAWALHGAEIRASWPHRRRPWAEQKLGPLAAPPRPERSAAHQHNGGGRT